ncbi:hypothetical protein M9H77_08623 [Catharanthus roseus]|uniref:Uncharacterized protein n=1 Tax=Catharanthus roseus TaxID=4058 RepID=A0ACC0BYM3_CATRO|nr:hypothetical protein M9H77_08623 [Catharanthus roseus]
MCNAHLVEEAVTFYSYYFEPHVSTKARDPTKNDKSDQLEVQESVLSFCNAQGRVYEVHNKIEEAFSKFNRRFRFYNMNGVPVPLVDVLFQGDIDIDATSRVDVDVQDVGTIVHKSGELESIEIHERNSIEDEDYNNKDEEQVKWESNNEEEEEEFQSESDSETYNVTLFLNDLFISFYRYMVYGSKKKSTHLETSTSASTSIPPETFDSASASIPPGTFASLATMFTPPAILTPFPQVSYSSLMPIFTPSSSFVVGTSSLACPQVPPVQGVVDSRILILPTTDRNTLLRLMQVLEDPKQNKEHVLDRDHNVRSALRPIRCPRIYSLVLCEWRVRWIWNRALVRCLAGIDYEMPELISNDLVMRFELCPWSPTVALHVHLNLVVEATLTCLDSFRLSSRVRTPHLTKDDQRRTGENGRGICTIRVCTSFYISKRGSRSICDLLKANAKRLHIETGSPMPIDEQLIFETTGDCNKGHVYSFSSQSAAITTERWGGRNNLLLVSSAVAYDAWIEREKRLCEYMQQA